MTCRFGASARLIPAHAGKTSSSPTVRSSPAAHPRSRGENIDGQRETVAEWGSSPLTRGKRPSTRLQNHVHGLIPAHAGKTRVAASLVVRRGAHPRSRGENSAIAQVKGWPSGSSPLTRGKLDKPWWTRERRGLIPAHAGKTAGILSSIFFTTAHPRSRGENHEGTEMRGACVGSSPLTRGKPHARP